MTSPTYRIAYKNMLFMCLWIKLGTSRIMIMNKSPTSIFFKANLCCQLSSGKTFSEKLGWCFKVQNPRRQPFTPISDYQHCCFPDILRNISSKTYSSRNFKKMSVFSFSLPILLRCIITRAQMNNLFGKKFPNTLLQNSFPLSLQIFLI